jgi:hypothetical protein
MDKVCDQAGLRGEFSSAAIRLRPSVYLDERVYRYLFEKAQDRGVPLDDLVNDLLKKSIELSWRLA